MFDFEALRCHMYMSRERLDFRVYSVHYTHFSQDTGHVQ